MQGDWNAKIGEDASKNWKGTCGQYCNPETNKRGFRLLEFASYNNLKVVNTFGPHKPSRHGTAQETITIRSTTSWSKLQVKCEHHTDQELSRSQYWKWPWACDDDRQTPPPKGEKSGQHKDQVQSRETQGPQHHRNVSNNDRRKVCLTLHPWKSGHQNRHFDQQF